MTNPMLKHAKDCECGRCLLASLKDLHQSLNAEERAAVADVLLEQSAALWEEESSQH